MKCAKLISGVLAAGVLLLPPAVFAQQLAPEASDIASAYDFCDHAELMKPEGIWKFPDDETVVLIKRSKSYTGRFDIFVVETPDCRLIPGERLGELTRTADASKFKLNLFTRRNTGVLTDSKSCSAELKESGDAFIMNPRKLKISFRTLWFLPKFWRSLRISVDDPASKLPYGMIRLYPRTEPTEPFYL